MPLVSLTFPRHAEGGATPSAHAFAGHAVEHGERPAPDSGAREAGQASPPRWALSALVAMRPARNRLERATMALRLFFFSAGASDAALLRGWGRWYRWCHHSTMGERAREVLGLVLLPGGAARTAMYAVREYGDEVRRQCGVSRARLFARFWWLRVVYGIRLDAFITFQLYRPERWRQGGRYIQVEELNRIYRLLNGRTPREGERDVIQDKGKFDSWCRAHGFPCPPTLLEVDGRQATTGREALGALPPRDLFSKPTNANSGVGACRWRYDGRGGYAGQDGRARSPEELAAELVEMSLRLKRPVIVQECLRNHPSLAALTTGGLCTVRIMTYRSPRGAVLPLLAAYKMPVGESVVDNVAQGAIVAHVDLASGLLRQAVHQPGKLFEPVERHPNTGARIEGTQLPFWREAVDLVVRAHEAAGQIVALGWDVALLEDGPLLIEGNLMASSRIAQLASGTPLADTPLAPALLEHLRESYGM